MTGILPFCLKTLWSFPWINLSFGTLLVWNWWGHSCPWEYNFDVQYSLTCGKGWSNNKIIRNVDAAGSSTSYTVVTPLMPSLTNLFILFSAVTAIDTSGIDLVCELRKMLEKRSFQVRLSLNQFHITVTWLNFSVCNVIKLFLM